MRSVVISNLQRLEDHIMSEQPMEPKGIHCKGYCCPFTPIFRSFRMAIHPSKLGLALVAVILIGLWGCLLDGIWLNKQKPLKGELDAYWQESKITKWRSAIRHQQFEQMQAAYPLLGLVPPENLAKRFDSDPAAEVSELKEEIEHRY